MSVTRRRPEGKFNTLGMVVLGSLVAAAGIVIALRTTRPLPASGAQRVIVYCAAGIREPVERIAAQYLRDYHVDVELRFGGSSHLMAQIEINKFEQPDLFIAGDDYYTKLIREKGLAGELFPVASMHAVLACRKDRPVKVASIDDLLKTKLRLSMPNPDEAALGRSVRETLSAIQQGGSTRWQQLEGLVRREGVFKPTVPDVATDIKAGTVDAGIVWDATVSLPHLRNDLMAIRLPELEAKPSTVTVAVLYSSSQPTAALKFARYLTARDKGLPLFAECGLTPSEGDAWAEIPRLKFFCGAVNRRVVESIIEKFQRREGVEIDTSFNGCGILTSQMNTISEQRTDQGFPDIYMACDVYYLDNVRQWFQEAVEVSDVEIVLAVPKGSTKVKKLEDLVAPGVRVTVGEPNQCTIGALTRRLLQAEGLWEKLQEKKKQPGEVVVEKASSAMLVPDAATGNADVTVAYISDARPNADKVDFFPIKSKHNLAIQPVTIAKTSPNKNLARRLLKQIVDSPDAFQNAGFHYRLEPPAGEAPLGKTHETGSKR